MLERYPAESSDLFGGSCNYDMRMRPNPHERRHSTTYFPANADSTRNPFLSWQIPDNAKLN